MRWRCLATLLAVNGCARVTVEKMPWSALPTASHMEQIQPPAEAKGGALESMPQPAPGSRTVVYHSADERLTFDPSLSAVAPLTLHWPLPTTGVNSLFGARSDPIDGHERHHNGVDLEGEYGAVVQACADGLVVWAGWNAGHGRQVVIEHRGGYRTGYSHLSQVLTFPGARLRAGEPVGRVGNSGRSTGPHLHFEVLRDDSYLDPLDSLGVALPTF